MTQAGSTILVTGGRGEIGSFFKKFCLATGNQVVDFETYEASPHDYEQPRRLLHMAARADSGDIDRMIDSNVNYLASVMRRSVDLGIEEVIFFSSAAIYGNQDRDALTEDDCMIAPSLYGVSKLLGEGLLEATPEIRSLCLRLPGVMEIGRSTTFISRTFDTLLQGKPVTLCNAARQFNHYLALPVLAEFVIGVTMRAVHDVINLAPSSEMTLHQVVSHLKSCMGSDSKINISPECRPFFSLSTDKAETNYQFNRGDPREQIDQWVQMRSNIEVEKYV